MHVKPKHNRKIIRLLCSRSTRPTDLSSYNTIRVGFGKPFDWYGIVLKYYLGLRKVPCPCPVIQPSESDDAMVASFAVLALVGLLVLLGQGLGAPRLRLRRRDGFAGRRRRASDLRVDVCDPHPARALQVPPHPNVRRGEREPGICCVDGDAQPP